MEKRSSVVSYSFFSVSIIGRCFILKEMSYITCLKFENIINFRSETFICLALCSQVVCECVQIVYEFSFLDYFINY